MKRLLAGGLVVVAALFASATSAEAIAIGATQIETYGPVAGCTTCSATASFTLNDANTLTVLLTNTSTDGISGQNLITQLGFDTTPNITVTGFTSTVAGWTVSNSNAVLQMEVLADTTSGTNASLDGGESVTFVIDFSPNVTTLALDDSAIHVQALSGGGSIKITGDGDGGTSDGDGGTSPEPASLLLFGLALSAVGMRMRKARS